MNDEIDGWMNLMGGWNDGGMDGLMDVNFI